MSLQVTGGKPKVLKKLCDDIAAFLRERTLIGEILGLNLAFAAVIGVLALASFWWASGWIIRDYIFNMSEQWLSSLDELGMPLYVSDDDEKYLRIENYVGNVSEIAFVRYYDVAGQPVFTEAPSVDNDDIPPLVPETLIALTTVDAGEQRYTAESLVGELPLMRIGKPIWTESLLMDGLLGFEFGDESAVQETLVGFVEIGLDFSNYGTQLARNILTGALIGSAVIILLTAASWFVYRRALLPLSRLQEPLKELAEGNTRTSVETSGHKEIVAIADALNTTVTALNERDKRLFQLANHDPLTGLINRHRFSELLEEELASAASCGKSSALLFIDLDQFKYVNDMFGHAAGDRLLVHVAEQLRAIVRKTDTVARFGGDEFLVLIRDVDRRVVRGICENILQICEHRFEGSDNSISVRCSIGVTMIRDGGLSPTDVLAQSDMACHKAKNRGRNRYDFYTASSREFSEMAADASWSQQVQRALKNDSFLFHYQPIVDIATGEPAFFEALLRMRLGPRKFIPPSAFLPTATRFGLMAEIDEWVIRNAVRKLALFRSKHGDIRFTVNVSGSFFQTENPFKYIDSHLKEHDVPIDAIVLELTEQVAVQSVGKAADQIAKMSERGCRFAIDDFGAGHSSYKHLKNLPVDFIKMDGGFVSNLITDVVDQKIVRSICEIAEATNSKAVAEHVGDYETLELLGELGVTYAQGFYLGKPSAKLKSEPLPVSIERKKKRRRKAG